MNQTSLHASYPSGLGLGILLNHLFDADSFPDLQTWTTSFAGKQRRPKHLLYRCDIQGGRRESRRESRRLPAAKPSTHTRRGRHSAQRRTCCIKSPISFPSRCALIRPPNHKRVGTSSAIANQAIPPWCLTRISSASSCPSSRGCWTKCACTCWQWRPARCCQLDTVRSSRPLAATIAASGHPYASNVITWVTFATG